MRYWMDHAWKNVDQTEGQACVVTALDSDTLQLENGMEIPAEQAIIWRQRSSLQKYSVPTSPIDRGDRTRNKPQPRQSRPIL